MQAAADASETGTSDDYIVARNEQEALEKATAKCVWLPVFEVCPTAVDLDSVLVANDETVLSTIGDTLTTT